MENRNPNRGVGAPDVCKGTIKPDSNTVDFCTVCTDGHIWLPGMVYHDHSYDARCLRCGLNARLTNKGIVEEWWW